MFALVVVALLVVGFPDETAILISGESARNAYQDNPDLFRMKFEGKRVQIVGRIFVGGDKDGAALDTSAKIAVFDNVKKDFLFFVEMSDAKDLTGLKVGDLVSIEGGFQKMVRSAGREIVGMNIDKGKIVKIPR